METMQKIKTKIDLPATFSGLSVCDCVEIPLTEEKESNIRGAAHRYAKVNSIELKVSVDKEKAVVTRIS